MKYIMIRKGERVFPVIFPDFMVHADVAKAIIVLEKADEAVAAGDCTIFDVGCSGSSQTLKMASRGDIDEISIKMGHYMAYIE